jgi:hypothetical protein
MARIRTIKPEFPQSESIGRLSRDARLLFIQMWTLADDVGRLRAASRALASLLYPYDEDAPSLIEGWLEELEREGCIKRYVVDGKTYAEISKWLEHQKIDKPSKPKFPEPANTREGSRGLGEGSGLDQGPRTKDQGEDQGEDRGADAPTAGDKAIAFKGREGFVKGVTEKSMRELQALCPAFTRVDIIAELELCDEYYAGVEKKPANWWFSTKAWAKRSHERRLKDKKAKRATEDAAYRGLI